MNNNFFKEIDFSRYTSIKIGPVSEVLVINEIGDYSDYQILGRGNNVLISDSHPKFAILGEEFNYIEQKDDLLYVGCATTSGKLLTYTRNNNIPHLEFLAKLPGNMGGLTKMNAGLKTWEVFNHVHSIKTKDGYVSVKDIDFSYRHTKIDTIIYEVVFNIDKNKKASFDKEELKKFNKMRDNQPHMPSAGSCFVNPDGDFAGRLIQEVGLKGYRIGDMGFSDVHANFLVNHGAGTFEQAMEMINLAKQKVKEKFNIDLKLEILVY